MKLKFDACSVESIKLDVVPLINQLHGPILITPEVKSETVEHNIPKYQSIAEKIKHFVDSKQIKLISAHGIMISSL
jgi:hypothetical protein